MTAHVLVTASNELGTRKLFLKTWLWTLNIAQIEVKSVRMPFLAKIGKCQNQKVSQLESFRTTQNGKGLELHKIERSQNSGMGQ